MNETLEFEALNQRGHEAAEAGRLEEALEIFDRLLGVAHATGERRQIDLAFCNRAAVAINLNQGAGLVPELREVLVRNGDPVNCRLAAYNISRHYERTKSYKKSLFYARLALDRSAELGRLDWLASSHNQIANAQLGESLVDEAAEEYEKALAAMPPGFAVWQAHILTNLGYCRIVQQRRGEGFRLLFRSLRVLRAHGAERYQIFSLLDLAFAYLEARRYGRALRHGQAALRIAERLGERESIKNALYLLGEAANLGGQTFLARRYFARLQEDYFPSADYLAPFLLAVNVRTLVNLHA